MITILTHDQKVAPSPSVRHSLKHAAFLYATGAVDDSNGGEVAMILDTMAENLPLIHQALQGLAESLDAMLQNGGVSSVNLFTTGGIPSFETRWEAYEYLAQIAAVASVLREQSA